ncbi:hypothetical protein BJ741DRAFT_617314 [Chytriomyces cf. hyalinus JEL632]|nr:hypothetical protein BJ741DRAFT_617314 [Chytriomyces cf. hyalinus JEL632]
MMGFSMLCLVVMSLEAPRVMTTCSAYGAASRCCFTDEDMLMALRLSPRSQSVDPCRMDGCCRGDVSRADDSGFDARWDAVTAVLLPVLMSVSVVAGCYCLSVYFGCW